MAYLAFFFAYHSFLHLRISRYHFFEVYLLIILQLESIGRNVYFFLICKCLVNFFSNLSLLAVQFYADSYLLFVCTLKNYFRKLIYHDWGQNIGYFFKGKNPLFYSLVPSIVIDTSAFFVVIYLSFYGYVEDFLKEKYEII